MTSSFGTGQGAFLGVALLVITAVQVQGCASTASSPDSAATGGNIGSGGAHATGGATGGSHSFSDASPPDGGPQTGFITWTYNDTPMGLYVPAPTGRPLPVVMYLHGCHNDPVYSEYWLIPAVNALEPCAVFLPTAPPFDDMCADWGGTYDTSGLRPAMINALAELDRLTGQYGFDTKRQYVYGESMGGEGVYQLLVEFPTRFAGAVAAAGYTLDTGAGQMAQTPLWIFHGSDDSISPVENDRAIYQSILDAGGTQVKYTEYPGLDHVPAVEQARMEPGLFEWLLAQRRN
jgi:predicted peptidase